MPARVVDATVMAAWAFREPHAEEALKLLRNAELYAPPLLAFELTRIARRKATTYPKDREAITVALRAALALPMRWKDVDHVAVMQLALETGLSTYEASYLHLARSIGAELVTFDDRLKKAAGTVRG